MCDVLLHVLRTFAIRGAKSATLLRYSAVTHNLWLYGRCVNCMCNCLKTFLGVINKTPYRYVFVLVDLVLVDDAPENDGDAPLLALLLLGLLQDAVAPNNVGVAGKAVDGAAWLGERDDLAALGVLEGGVAGGAKAGGDGKVLRARLVGLDGGRVVVERLPLARVLVPVEARRLDVHLEEVSHALANLHEGRAALLPPRRIVSDPMAVAVPRLEEALLGDFARLNLAHEAVVKVGVAGLGEDHRGADNIADGDGATLEVRRVAVNDDAHVNGLEGRLKVLSVALNEGETGHADGAVAELAVGAGGALLGIVIVVRIILLGPAAPAAATATTTSASAVAATATTLAVVVLLLLAILSGSLTLVLRSGGLIRSGPVATVAVASAAAPAASAAATVATTALNATALDGGVLLVLGSLVSLRSRHLFFALLFYL